jgi:probable blue pigment (indigoidine) exporter
MEDTWLWTTPAVTLVAPIAWGTTYVVTQNFLPPDRPFFSAAVRALPVGLVIVASRRQLPRGSWWWKSLVLGTLNMGLFFALLFTAAYRLTGGLASTVTAMSPLAVMALAAVMIRERPSAGGVAGGLVGIAGVTLLVLRADASVDVVGLLAAVGAVLSSGIGFVLVKRWGRPTDLVTTTGWQLTAAGFVLLPLALIVEGRPPHVDATNVGGYLWLGVVGTGVAYVCWFHGLSRMTAGATALVGLVNPVIGTTLGVVVMHEHFGPAQAVGIVLVLSGVLGGQPAVLRLLRRHVDEQKASTSAVVPAMISSSPAPTTVSSCAWTNSAPRALTPTTVTPYFERSAASCRVLPAAAFGVRVRAIAKSSRRLGRTGASAARRRRR